MHGISVDLAIKDGFVNLMDSLHGVFANFWAEMLRMLRPVFLPTLQFIHFHGVEASVEVVEFTEPAHLCALTLKLSGTRQRVRLDDLLGSELPESLREACSTSGQEVS